jgi:ABC-type uncharacterized transport system involved in gliding motility auxiliary subunit
LEPERITIGVCLAIASFGYFFMAAPGLLVAGFSLLVMGTRSALTRQRLYGASIFAAGLTTFISALWFWGYFHSFADP